MIAFLRTVVSNPSNWWSHSRVQLILSSPGVDTNPTYRFSREICPPKKQQVINKLKKKHLRDSCPVCIMQTTCFKIILLGTGAKLAWKAYGQSSQGLSRQEQPQGTSDGLALASTKTMPLAGTFLHSLTKGQPFCNCLKSYKPFPIEKA